MEEIFKHQVQRFRTNFYRDHNNLDEEVHLTDNSKRKKFVLNNSYESENLFVENYANPICSVIKKYGMVLVVQNEKKISIKVFTGTKIRLQGTSWFREKKLLSFLTVNKETGDYYSGWIEDYHKKRKSKKLFRKNCHNHSPFLKFYADIKTLMTDVDGDFLHPEIIYDKVLEVFFSKLCDSPIELSELNKLPSSRACDRLLLKFYLDTKKIKYPNNFSLFFNGSEKTLTLKLLRKNKMKLVDAFMDKFQLNGKSVKNALHKTNKLNFRLLQISYQLFDESWINSDENLLLDLLDSKIEYSLGAFYQLENLHLNKMTKFEKKKVFDLFVNHVLLHQIDFWTFMDHIIMYNDLKQYGENNLRWKSTNSREFRVEHLDWVDNLEYYKKGDYFRIYPNYMYEILNQELKFENNVYYAVLLDNSRAYNEESMVQSNCVKGYIGKSSSLIISVRKDSLDSSERATVEYVLYKKNEKINFRRTQFLGRFNSSLSEDWVSMILKLDERVLSCIEDKRYETVKIKKICSNGVEMYSDSNWNDEGNLRWTYKNIE